MFSPAASRRLGRATASPLCYMERRDRFVDALREADGKPERFEVTDLPQWVQDELAAFETSLRELADARGASRTSKAS